MWEPRGLPLGETGVSQLVCARSRHSPLKGGNSRVGLSSSHTTHFGIHRGGGHSVGFLCTTCGGGVFV
jgi:hypothetical protein